MKRFIVFKGSDYYPCGGAQDHLGYFDMLPSLELPEYTWANALDTQTNEVFRLEEGAWELYSLFQHERVL